MGLDAVAAISAVLGVPLTAVPVGLTIHGAIQSFRPKSKLKKWSIRIEEIAAMVASKGDMITPKEMKKFLRVLEDYKNARDSFRQRIKDGTCTWYGRGKGHAAEFSDVAREAWDVGLYISTEASTRKAQSHLQNNTPQSVTVVQVPTTSTSDSSSCLPNELWSIRIEQISTEVASKGDMIMPEEMEEFLRLVELYKDARDASRQRINDGTCTWIVKGKGHAQADDYSDCAREAWETGLSISTEASMRKARRAQSYFPYSAQPSGVWVPATTDTSLLNNGGSRQSSSLDEESFLENGPHSENSLGTAESSGSSTSDSSNYLSANELPSSGHPPVYSEAVSDGGIREDNNSGSVSSSNNMAHEEVEAVYDLWRQMPEEQCPWGSTVSLLDKLRARGLITRQYPHSGWQH